MSPGSALLAHGPMLALGVSLVLGAGVAGVALARAPGLRRQRAERTVVAALSWLVLALLPLPRPWAAHAAAAPVSAAVPGIQRPDLQWLGDGPRRDAIPVAPATTTAATPLRIPDPPVPTAIPTAPDLPPAPPVAADPAWSWPQTLAVAIAATAVLGLLRLLLGAWALARVLAVARPAPPALTALLHATPGARPGMRVLLSPRARGPFCLAARGGTVVLPQHLGRGAPELLRAVLAHEVAHLVAGDPWRQLMFALAAPLLGLHPLFWWLRRRAHLCAELLADAHAAAQVGTQTYVQTFINLAAQGAAGRTGLLATVPALRSRSEFYRRMTMLLERSAPLPPSPSPRRRRVEAAGVACLVLALGASLGVQPAAAQERTQTKAPEPAAQKELDALRAERDALRDEIQKLKVAMQQIAGDLTARPGATGPSEPGAHAQANQSAAEFIALLKRVLGEQLKRHPEDAEQVKLQLGQIPTLADAFQRAGAAADRLEATIGTMPPAMAKGAPGAGGDAYVLDLLTRSVDLQTELELQGRKLERLRELAKNALVPTGDLAEAETRLIGGKRKLELVQAALEAEAAATRSELELLVRQREAGTLPAEGQLLLIRAKTRLELLARGGTRAK